MNNLNQKKIIAENTYIRQMPYGKVGCIQYDYDTDSDARLDSPSLNNMFQQLIDNDVYIENSLNQLAQFNPGPKSPDSVEDGYDGYKFLTYTDDGDPVVKRKIDSPLSDIISAVSKVPNCSYACNFMFEKDGTYFAGFDYSSTNTKSMLSSSNGYSGWTQAFQSTASYKKHLEYNGNDFILYGRKLICLNKTNDIYERTVLCSFGEDISAIDIDSSGIFYAISGNALLSSAYQNNNMTTFNPIVQNISVASVNDMALTEDESSIVLASKNGAYISEVIDSFTDFHVLTCQSHINQIIQYNGSLYFATEKNGILKRTSGLTQVDDTAGKNITHMEEHDGDLYYSVYGENGGIYMLGGSIYSGVSSDVKDFRWYDDILIVQYEKQLGYYINDAGKFVEIKYGGESIDCSGGTGRLAMPNLNTSGGGTLYSYFKSSGGDGMLKTFELNGTLEYEDRLCATTDSGNYSVNGSFIVDNIKDIIYGEQLSDTLVVTDNYIARFSNFDDKLEFDSSITINSVVVEQDRMFIQCRSGSYGYIYIYNLTDFNKINQINLGNYNPSYACTFKDYLFIECAVSEDQHNIKLIYINDKDTYESIGDQAEDSAKPGLEKIFSCVQIIPFNDSIYVLNTDGSLHQYELQPAPLASASDGPFDCDFLTSDEVLNLETIDRHDSYGIFLNDDDEEEYEIISSLYKTLVLKKDGLYLHEYDRYFNQSQPDSSECIRTSNLIDGGIANFYADIRANDMLFTIGNDGCLSVMANEDVYMSEDPKKFIDSAGITKVIDGDDTVNCVANCFPDDAEKQFYIAGTTDGFGVFNIGISSSSVVKNVYGADSAAGKFIYITHNSTGSSTMHFDSTYDDRKDSYSIDGDSELDFCIGMDCYKSEEFVFSRIIAFTSNNKYYLDIDQDGEPIKFGQIVFTCSDENVDIKYATTTYGQNQDVVLVAQASDGAVYSCTTAQLLKSDDETSDITVECVQSDIGINAAPAGIEVEYENDQTTYIFAAYNDGTGSADETKTETIKKAKITVSNESQVVFSEKTDYAVVVESGLDKPQYFGNYIVFQDGSDVSYFNSDDGTTTRLISNADVINDGFIKNKDGNIYAVCLYEDGEGQDITLKYICNFGDVDKLFGRKAFLKGNDFTYIAHAVVKNYRFLNKFGGITAAAYSEQNNTLFVANDGKVFYSKLDKDDITSSINLDKIFSTEAVDFQDNVVKIVTLDDCVIAVTKNRQAVFTFSEQEWKCKLYDQFSGSTEINGIAVPDSFTETLDSSLNRQTGVIYLTNIGTARYDDGIELKYASEVESTSKIVEMAHVGSLLVLKDQTVKIHVFDGETLIDVDTPDGSDAKIVGAYIDDSGIAHSSGYIKLGSSLWEYFEDTDIKTAIPFDINCGIFKSFDMHIVGTSVGLKKLEYLKYDILNISEYDSVDLGEDALVGMFTYHFGQNVTLILKNSAEQAVCWKYEKQNKQLFSAGISKAADAFADIGPELYTGNIQFAVVNGKFLIYKNGSVAYDMTNGMPADITPKKLSMVYLYENAYYACFDNIVLQFAGFKSGFRFIKIDSMPAITYKKVRQVDGQFVFSPESGGGLYIYDIDNGFGYKTAPAGGVGTLMRSSDTGETIYYISQGNTILSSSNLRLWNNFVALPSGVKKITGMFKFGRNQFVFMTDNGAYASKYQYTVETDTAMMTEHEAWTEYEDNKNGLSSVIKTEIDKHGTLYHDEDSQIAKFQQAATVEFDIGLDSSITDITNVSSQGYDFVNQIFISDTDKDSSDTIIANVYNSYTGTENVKCNWIVRPYYSGITDIDIYLWTTNTYYIPHMSGAGMYEGDPTIARSHRNLDEECNSTLSDNYTTITIGILSTIFNIDSVLDVTIQGNSLPKKIYKDTVNNDEGTTTTTDELYSSFAEPSLVDQDAVFNVRSDGYGHRMFYFYCFGTDAQAIHMTVYDSKRNYKKNLYKIILHGVDFKTSNGDNESVTQTLVAGSSAKLFSYSIFSTNTSTTFRGWSTSQYLNSSKPDISDLYRDEKEISTGMIDALTNTRQINLYAVWN